MTLVLAQVRRVVAGLLPLAVVTGCASTDLGPAAKAQLERAQAAYRQAQADPNVQAYAQLWLPGVHKGGPAAAGAKTLWEKGSLRDLAEKRAPIATIAGATTKTGQATLQVRPGRSGLL